MYKLTIGTRTCEGDPAVGERGASPTGMCKYCITRWMKKIIPKHF